MGRKRRDMTGLRPFCFYCQRSFKNEVILHHHQKAKHFSCPKCPKKFSSIDSMIQHARSQHNETIQRVPNANRDRDSIALKIFGMQGVPRFEIDNWIVRCVNRSWGRLMDRKLQARRKLKGLEAVKQQIEEEKAIQEEPNNKQIEEQLQYPLEFSFK